MLGGRKEKLATTAIINKAALKRTRYLNIREKSMLTKKMVKRRKVCRG